MARDPSKPEGESRAPAESNSVSLGPTGSGPYGTNPGAAAVDVETLQRMLQALAAAGGVPISVSQAPTPPLTRLGKALADMPPVTVAFPPCSDVMLALINTTTTPKDDVTRFFEEYFTFEEHRIVATPQGIPLGQVLDPGLIGCTSDVVFRRSASDFDVGWPPPWCLPPTCVTLKGNRRLTGPVPPPDDTLRLKRLYMGDVMFAYWLGDRLGIHQMLGAILDDFATRGTFPITNGSLDTNGASH